MKIMGHSLFVFLAALLLSPGSGNASILQHYDDQEEVLGEPVLTFDVVDNDKEVFHLKVPISNINEQSWYADGSFDLDWSYCHSKEFSSGSGELNQCVRRAELTINGESDVLGVGLLKVRAYNEGNLRFTVYDQSQKVTFSVLAYDTQGLLKSITSKISRHGGVDPARLPATGDSVDFVFFGDAGTGDQNQYEVGDRITQFCQENVCEFALMLGDNFYNSGVKTGNDSKFQTNFEVPYKDHNFPYYVVLGNHDHLGDIKAQISYTDRSNLWNMPARYYSFKRGQVSFYGIDSDDFDKNQRDWLATQLKQDNSIWKIVYAHHPIYSYGSHGNTSKLINDLLPLLKENGVQFFLNGHDHDKQHIVRSGINFVTAGSGAKLRPTKRGSYSKYASSRLGFGYMSISPNQATLKFVDVDGSIEYQTQISH